MTRFRASSIGNCLLEIVASVLDPESTRAPDSKRVFLQIGHALQPVLDEYLERSGFSIIDGEVEVQYEDQDHPWVLTGHVDAVCRTPKGEEILVEYKCITSKKWNEVKHCKDWRTIYPRYYAQVQAYMGMSKIHKCLMVFMNRDTAEIILGWDLEDSIYREDCLVTFDPETYVVLLTRLDAAKTWVDGKTIPDRELCDTIGFCYYCRGIGNGEHYSKVSVRYKVDSDTIRLIKERRKLNRVLANVNKRLRDKFDFYDAEYFRVDIGLKSGKARLSKFDVVKGG